LLLHCVGELPDEKLVKFPVDVNSLCYKAPETTCRNTIKYTSCIRTTYVDAENFTLNAFHMVLRTSIFLYSIKTLVFVQ